MKPPMHHLDEVGGWLLLFGQVLRQKYFPKALIAPTSTFFFTFCRFLHNVWFSWNIFDRVLLVFTIFAIFLKVSTFFCLVLGCCALFGQRKSVLGGNYFEVSILFHWDGRPGDFQSIYFSFLFAFLVSVFHFCAQCITFCTFSGYFVLVLALWQVLWPSAMCDCHVLCFALFIAKNFSIFISPILSTFLSNLTTSPHS